jgi:methanogenic corrinoid protein MtbC1
MRLHGDDHLEYGLTREVYRRSFDGISLLRNSLPEAEVRKLAAQVVANLNHRLSTHNGDVGLPSSEELDALCTALISSDEDNAMELVLQFRRDGVALETIYVHHLAEAARRLGAWWEEDRVSFVDVTVGTGRIFAIICALRTNYLLPPRIRNAALFATVPGEDHRLGIEMAAELFRDKGWHIDVLVGRTQDEILSTAVRLDAGVIGLSASAEQALPALAELIITLRIKMPTALILVSGPVVDIAGEIVKNLGVDLATSDLNEARRFLEEA